MPAHGLKPSQKSATSGLGRQLCALFPYTSPVRRFPVPLRMRILSAHIATAPQPLQPVNVVHSSPSNLTHSMEITGRSGAPMLISKVADTSPMHINSWCLPDTALPPMKSQLWPTDSKGLTQSALGAAPSPVALEYVKGANDAINVKRLPKKAVRALRFKVADADLYLHHVADRLQMERKSAMGPGLCPLAPFLVFLSYIPCLC